MDIRAEETTDYADVDALQLEAFGDHGPVVVNLIGDLRPAAERGDGLSLVAELDGRIVGHAMFSPSLVDALPRLVPVQVLSPIGVEPRCRRRGVGSALVRQGTELLAARGVPLVFLEGSPAYYARFGFEPGEAHGFGKPSPRIPGPGFQVLRLPAHEPWMTGTLVYSEAFWRNDVVGLREPRLSQVLESLDR